MARRRGLPQYCSEFQDRHGKWRVRFRRTGFRTHCFQSLPSTEAFWAEYRSCLAGVAAPAVQPGAGRHPPGSLHDLIARYYRAPEFLNLSPWSQITYRGIIERFRLQHGDKPVAGLRPLHVKAIIGAMADRPVAANNLLRMIRMLMRFAISIELRKDDPTAYVRGFSGHTKGFYSWTEADIACFVQRHPPGSTAYLALSLMLYLAVRRSDVVQLGWHNIKGGKVELQPTKTECTSGKLLRLPIHRDLAAVIETCPKGAGTFLRTSFGKPFTAAGFATGCDRCNEAGLPQCSSHGLSKAAARRLAEAGLSEERIKAVTGHTSSKSLQPYIRAADQERLAEDALQAISGFSTAAIG
jgi:hypothetical protein